MSAPAFALPPVGAPRAGSILAGAILLQELAAKAGVDRLFLCDRALREGLVLEALGAPAPKDPVAGEVRRRQILDLASRAPGMLAHAQQAPAAVDAEHRLGPAAADERDGHLLRLLHAGPDGAGGVDLVG